MAFLNSFFIKITAGNSAEIPQGFMMASILPDSNASYTITNSIGGDLGPNALATSTPISGIYTFPLANPFNQNGYDTHTVTAIGGDVLVSYFK